MPSRQRTREGVKRPSRVRHDRGLRADGTLRPSRQRHNAERAAKRIEYGGSHTKKSRLERPFWGISGQGAGDGEGHALVSLRSGEHVILSGDAVPDIAGTTATGQESVVGDSPSEWRIASPLTFQVCMTFLSATVPNDCQPVCWELDWLVAMMCKSLPRAKLEELVDREGRCPPDDPWRPRPVTTHGFGFDWLPAHWFSLRTPSGRSIRISDPHRFWGRELSEAAASEGVELADDADLEDRTACLEAVMTRFRERCIEHNAVPRYWEGPGQGASKFMSDWGIKDHLSEGYRP